MNNKRKFTKAEQIWIIISNIIFLWILSRVPYWDLKFLAENYTVVLLFMKINCYVQIGAAVLILLIGIMPIRYLIKTLSEISGLLVAILLFYLYPFNFSAYFGMEWFDLVLKIIFIIAIIASAISVIVNFIRIFRSDWSISECRKDTGN